MILTRGRISGFGFFFSNGQRFDAGLKSSMTAAENRKEGQMKHLQVLKTFSKNLQAVIS